MNTDAEYVQFVHARSRALFRAALLLTSGDHATAEDLLQTALVRAYVSWGRLRAPEAAEAFVRRILVNTAINQHRARRRKPEVLTSEVPAGHLAAPAEGYSIEDRLDLWIFLRDLSPRQRAVIVLRYYEDLSEASIAELVGCSPGAVKSHASRALQALRRQWAEPHAGTPSTEIRGHR